MKDFKPYHNKPVFRSSVAYSEAQSSRGFFVKQMGHRWVTASPQPTLHTHAQPSISYSYSLCFRNAKDALAAIIRARNRLPLMQGYWIWGISADTIRGNLM